MAGSGKLKVIPLGGLGEIGRNMTVLEWDQEILVVDAGVMFPEAEMLGVDLVIPNTTYLVQNKDRIRAFVITHGHEDHTGALPYVLPQLGPAHIYATPLTLGLISAKLREHRLLERCTLHTLTVREPVQVGVFRVEPFRVNHSIPDSIGLAITTPVGTIVHTGDFKFDHTPVDGKPTDFAKLAELGGEGVLCLLSDSTYADLPGYTPSEAVVSRALLQVMAQAPARVIVATFASHISRIQQVINAAFETGRKVAIFGRSMLQNVEVAVELGYLTPPPGVMIHADEVNRYDRRALALLTTGSQGEPGSALARIANRDHRIKVHPEDTVVISASPIPGNEQAINRTIDNLLKQGANVLYSRIADVHVPGHASQEELKLMLALLKPKFFVPIHGQYRQLFAHARLAQNMGIPADNIFVLEDGHVLELTDRTARVTGKVPAGYVFVDSLGELGPAVLRDRQRLAADGVLVVIVTVDRRTGRILSRPDIIARGLGADGRVQELLDRARGVLMDALDRRSDRLADWSFINAKVKEVLGRLVYQETRARPLILSVPVEI
ncbi:MAG: ribonuclease J [Chloroflexota bacterium]